MKLQRVYGGVVFGLNQPSPRNVARLDANSTPMIVSMMSRGIQIDPDHFRTMERVLSDDMERITEEVRSLTGALVNLDSGDQVSNLLFKKLGLKQARPRFTPSQSRESTDEETLIAIKHDHPVISKILDYKEFSKLLGTYVRPIPKLARRVAFGQWRLYPNLGMTRIPSGRLNCKAPNLLATPNRTPRGREVCKGFITDSGWTFLSVDESQIEVRVIAHRSQDPALMQIYFDEDDIYSDFAIKAFNLPDQRYRDGTGWHYPNVDKKTHRFPSKTCILSAIYRISAKGLLEKMPPVCAVCMTDATEHTCQTFQPLWTENKCQDLLNAFLLSYPGISKSWVTDDTYVRRHGYICDEFGRLLHVIAVRSVLRWVVNGALREAGNMPTQSGAQGTIKLVMAEVQDTFEREGMLGNIVNPLLQVHDELLFEVREDMAEEIGEYVAHTFEHCVQLRVPIKAGTAVAANWGSLAK